MEKEPRYLENDRIMKKGDSFIHVVRAWIYDEEEDDIIYEAESLTCPGVVRFFKESELGFSGWEK